jgi:ribonuclease HI
MEKQQMITIFTDGSSRGNPGPGGWGTIVIAQGKVWELGGREAETTNNRMELTAALRALEHIETKKLTGDAVVYIDSAYVLQGVTGWMFGWEKNGWKTQAKEDVLNQDIWRELLAISYRLKSIVNIRFEKVSGHAGVFGNERVDVIATAYADHEKPLLFVGALSQYEQIIGGDIFSLVETVVKKKKSSNKNKGPAYSYVSLVDGKIHTDKTWAICEKRVKGKKGVKFKKVFSKQEEDELKKEWLG